MTPFEDLPPDVQDVAERLSDERPRPAPHQLDAVRTRVFPRRSRRAGAFGATALLGLGVLLTGGSASVALVDLSSAPRQSAVQAQYPTTPTTPETTGTTSTTTSTTSTVQTTPPQQTTTIAVTQPQREGQPAPEQETENETELLGETEEDDSGQGAPSDGDAEPVAEDIAPQQVTQQLEGGDEELPFTGYAAVPMLLLGALLIVAGTVLRRRLSADDARS